MPSYLVTGSSRGLGLGLVTELLKNGQNTMIATARNTASSAGLQKLKGEHADGRLQLVDLDVTSQESIRAAAESTRRLLPRGLDHLISNAGVSYGGLADYETLDLENFKAEVEFNIISPVLLLREFLPLVRQSEEKKILVITSSLGSIELGASLPGLANSYSVAKAALNMLVRKWSSTLKNDGITTVLLHPGWIGETELGSGITAWVEKYAPELPNLTVETSAADCVKVLEGVTAEDNGLFFNHDGMKLPW